MKCEDSRTHFVELLYGEIDSGSRRQLERHLAECKNCTEEYATLEATSGALGRWEDEEIARHIALVESNEPLFGRLMGAIRTAIGPGRNLSRPLAIAGAAAVLIFALSRTQAKYENGTLNFRFGGDLPLTGNPTPVMAPEQVVYPTGLEVLQLQNLLVMRQLIRDSEENLRSENMNALGLLVETFERRRYDDLRLIDRTLSDFQMQTQDRFARTENLLGGILTGARGEPKAATPTAIQNND